MTKKILSARYWHSCEICALSLMLLACGISSCACEECDLGEQWCEGSVAYECMQHDSSQRHSQEMYAEAMKDCADMGAACVEADLNEHNDAYCGFPDYSCPGFETYLCLGETVAFCAEGMEYPEYVEDCSAEDRYCQETMSGDRPGCSLIDQACNSEDDEACFDLYPDKTFHCDDGVWIGSQCSLARVCCELVGGDINCVFPENTSNCMNY